MQFIGRILGVFTCAAFVNSMPAFAQFNDDCSSPVVINTTGVFAFDNSLASAGTQGPGNPLCATVGRDLWYRWTAPSTGLARLQTCGQVAHDSAIAVFAGSSCPTQISIACDDDACGLESLTTWNATVGTTYMLEIGSSGGGPGGAGTFTIDITGTPANDDCAAALPITGGSGYDNSQATTGTQGQGNPGCTDVHNDLWFEWTATMNGTATLDTCFQSAMDTVVAVYVGAGCPAGSPFACDDNSCGLQSQVTFAIVAGVVYTIEVGGAPFTPGGPGSFVITEQGGGSSGVGYCSGDGTATLCPCGNNGFTGHGCGNSIDSNGALLTSAGGASVSNDTLVLQGSGMPTTASALYFQGTQQTNNGQGLAFGDGLRCVGGTVVRLGTKTNAGGMSSFGGPVGDTPISTQGQIPLTGGTRDYQIWYRNAALFCVANATFNLSNGLEIVWAP